MTASAAGLPLIGERYGHGGYLTLSQAAASLPGRPHLSTLHRWRLRGVRGVRLQTCRIGGRRFNRPEWIADFIDRSNPPGDDSGVAPPDERVRGRERAIRDAEAELAAAGVSGPRVAAAPIRAATLCEASTTT